MIIVLTFVVENLHNQETETPLHLCTRPLNVLHWIPCWDKFAVCLVIKSDAV